MPRCATSASSPTGSHKYLPRRLAASIVRPVRRAMKSAAPASWRRIARGCKTSTVSTVRPTTNCSSPRRTTSTSGSSGTDLGPVGRAVRVGGRRLARQTLGDGVPGCLSGLLLRFFLRPAFAFAVDLPADPNDGMEELLVVRPALIDVVFRDAKAQRRGQFLE